MRILVGVLQVLFLCFESVGTGDYWQRWSDKPETRREERRKSVFRTTYGPPRIERVSRWILWTWVIIACGCGPSADRPLSCIDRVTFQNISAIVGTLKLDVPVVLLHVLARYQWFEFKFEANLEDKIHSNYSKTYS